MLISRRTFIGASAGGVLHISAADAAWWGVAWKAIQGISAIWGAKEAVEGVWKNVFPGSPSQLAQEQTRGQLTEGRVGNIVIDRHYEFHNNYHFKGFSQREPGLICGHPRVIYAVYLVTHTNVGFLNLGSGLAICVDRLIRDVSGIGFDKEKVSAYTRPMALLERPSVESLGGVIRRHSSSYRSPFGRVKLSWEYDPDDYQDGRYLYSVIEDSSGRRII